MSKELTIEKIKTANSVLSLAKTIYQQLIALEKGLEGDVGKYFDSLILVQTSLYSTLILNMYHLLKNGEKHSISELLRISKAHLGLTEALVNAIMNEVNKHQDEIQKLQENRDKRIAHFDKKSVCPLKDESIELLLGIIEKAMKQLTIEALRTDHAYGIPLSRGIDNILKILNDQIDRENQKYKTS